MTLVDSNGQLMSLQNRQHKVKSTIRGACELQFYTRRILTVQHDEWLLKSLTGRGLEIFKHFIATRGAAMYCVQPAPYSGFGTKFCVGSTLIVLTQRGDS